MVKVSLHVTFPLFSTITIGTMLNNNALFRQTLKGNGPRNGTGIGTVIAAVLNFPCNIMEANFVLRSR